MYTKIIVEQDYPDKPVVIKRGLVMSLDETKDIVTVYPVHIEPDELKRALMTLDVILQAQKK